MASPITANSTSWLASAPMVAPTSRTMLSLRSVGHIAAMAGREMPGSVLRMKRAMAISAPVLPADTAASASPVRTASIVIHMLLLPRPWRSAWLGLASMVTSTSVWRISERCLSLGWRSSKGAMRLRSPTSRKRSSGWRIAHSAAPGITTSGPSSPPIASSAMVKCLLSFKLLPIAAPTARPRPLRPAFVPLQ